MISFVTPKPARCTPRGPRRSSCVKGPERLEDRTLLANTVGLISHDVAAAYQGYTLFAPSNGTTTYLVDMAGNQVRSWQSSLTPMTAELLPDGSLIRAGRVPTQGVPANQAKQWAPGQSGRIEKFDWDGNLTWSYTLATPDEHLHHDFEVKPNGNVLMITWERKTYAEAVQAGRRPGDVPVAPGTDGIRELWPDSIIEVRPNQPAAGATYAEGGEIVWRWDLWDHLVQNINPQKDNYGQVARNPQKIDINYYLKGTGMGGVPADWTHFNSIDYNPDLKQILVSSREFSELWIIDQSTTTEEARGSTGGLSGKGGDILYRFGNPAAYGRGSWQNQQLHYQHDPQWIKAGLPGAGNILVFDNGWSSTPERPSFSRVLEIARPDDGAGRYRSPIAPARVVWRYASNPPNQFFARIISGAQRLPNGNTLINEGTEGRFFEVTKERRIVWEYRNPVVGRGPSGILRQGQVPPINQQIRGLKIPGVFTNLVFRAYRYGPEFSGFAGRDLTATAPIELPRAAVATAFASLAR
ncbi:MAG: aryl-sulfate sulfotransferase [Planctomycetaceae bacterium]